MNRTWFSYVVLAVGLMLLVASDKHATADDKKTAHTMSFGSEQQFEIFVNKDGTEEAQVKMVIDGQEYNFDMPDVADGEDQVITTDDGKEITVKSVSGKKMIWIDGNQMHLPLLGKHKMHAEGLSAMIGRTHQMKMSNEVSIRANGLDDDVQAAILDAVKGVLTSYNVDKSVSINNNEMALHFISEDDMKQGNNQFKFEITTDGSADDESLMVIHKETIVEEN